MDILISCTPAVPFIKMFKKEKKRKQKINPPENLYINLCRSG